MGKFSRDKGNRREREVVNRCRESGLGAVRVPLSGASEAMKGDVRIRHHTGRFALCGEVKARKEFHKWLLDWMGCNDVLFLVGDRTEVMVVMPMREWLKVAR